jgi:hypothetical protein
MAALKPCADSELHAILAVIRGLRVELEVACPNVADFATTVRLENAARQPIGELTVHLCRSDADLVQQQPGIPWVKSTALTKT